MQFKPKADRILDDPHSASGVAA